jgi:hypothetical protein
MSEIDKTEEMDLAFFGIGFDSNIKEVSTDDLHDLLYKTRSKVFDVKGKVIRQTLTAEEKVDRKLKKLMADPTISREEKMSALIALRKSLDKKEEA